jgi:hypothetical protein
MQWDGLAECLGLNLPTDLDVSPGIGMTMLPTIMVGSRFEHWDEYLVAFHSPCLTTR